MTHDPDQPLRCVTTELDLLDAVAQRQASVQLLLEEAGRELTLPTPDHESAHADLGDALVLLAAAARGLARAYAAARGYVYDLPTRRDAR